MNDEVDRYNNQPVPKKLLKQYQNRLRQFTDTGQYSNLYLPQFYDRARTDKTEDVKLQVWSVPGLERPRFKEAMKRATWRATRKGEQFGPSWSTHWFKVQLKVPSDWADAEQIIWNWDSSDEGFLFDEEGNGVIGLSNQDRKEWIVPNEWKDGKWHTFYIETSCNEMSGDGSPPNMNRYFRLNTADLVWPHLEARALYIDYWIMTDGAREMSGWQKHRARELGNQIIDTFDPNNADESIAKCRKIASKFVGELVNSSDVYKNSNENFVYAIGNCHIDTAWLWPFAETHRKVGRSWASQLQLLDRYPEYIFAASQIQQFHWLSQDYPDVFERVKTAAKGGRFICIGGSWVEHDTNMPSGESMTRQFLLGQRFFEHHFGFRTRTFWLPDSFGYSPQVPQFCRLAGMDRFLTQKLSWSDTNSFPHSSFRWVALDGSQVVVHCPPDNTYTAPAHFGDVARSLNNHKDLEVDRVGMLLYGYGDGGGGPTAEMIEKLRRCRGVADTVGELPRVVSGPTVDEFYDKIVEDTDNGNKLATWNGEMYLEYHRGTYTTQGAIKRGNRYSELLMHDVEWIATLASVVNADYKYPTKDIEGLWQDVCLNQFHDVLPGSSIEMVYDDARPLYDSIFKRGQDVVKKALDALGVQREKSKNAQLVAINTYPWARSEIIEVEEDREHAQVSGEKNLVRVVADNAGVARPVDVAVEDNMAARAKETSPGVFELSNSKLKVTVVGGSLTSVWDIEESREVLAEGQKGNQLVIYNDTPLSFPAWDTDLYHLDTRKEVAPGTVTITETGPLRASLEVVQQISPDSSIKTTISLDSAHASNEDSLISFTSEVDWHETYKFLKVEFPVDVRSDFATYETSYGSHRRATHFNTSWDTARFEVCGHKWADLSDNTYGVAILNDSKYGYAVHGNMMRLSLLRSPKSPDAHADMGKHVIRYAMYPHLGPGVTAGVVRAGYNFNHPLKAAYVPNVAKPVDEHEDHVFSAITLRGNPALVLATIKRHEDDEDTSLGLLPVRGAKGAKNVITRVYDSLGGRARGTIRCEFGIAKAFKVNSLEDDLEEIKVNSDGRSIDIEHKPFEIASYRLQLA